MHPMEDGQIIETAQQAMLITMQISAPVLLVGLVVGVAIALIQALTQIQEITLVFVPKIMAIFLSMFIFLPWMLNILVGFTQSLATLIVNGG